MPKFEPIAAAERAKLRRLYLAARGGRWEAQDTAGGHVHLYAVAPDGGRRLLAMPSKPADAQLMAAARNALPRHFAEIDGLRARSNCVPALGTVR